jgi:hypothetical protein
MAGTDNGSSSHSGGKGGAGCGILCRQVSEVGIPEKTGSLTSASINFKISTSTWVDKAPLN